MEAFVKELKVKKEIMKQLLDIHDLEKMRHNPTRGHDINADQVAALLKEMKELVDELKTQRQKAKTDGGK
jgi:hypothetical protein